MDWWAILLIVLFFSIFSFAFGWFVAVTHFKKQIKKNPPINEAQIRFLYKQIGRKPSEKQIKQILSSFK